jgi:hypothetical protein
MAAFGIAVHATGGCRVLGWHSGRLSYLATRSVTAKLGRSSENAVGGCFAFGSMNLLKGTNCIYCGGFVPPFQGDGDSEARHNRASSTARIGE